MDASTRGVSRVGAVDLTFFVGRTSSSGRKRDDGSRERAIEKAVPATAHPEVITLVAVLGGMLFSDPGPRCNTLVLARDGRRDGICRK